MTPHQSLPHTNRTPHIDPSAHELFGARHRYRGSWRRRRAAHPSAHKHAPATTARNGERAWPSALPVSGQPCGDGERGARGGISLGGFASL
eukprot:scaffold2380_cov102-Isochrysis_galbana.AAC.18